MFSTTIQSILPSFLLLLLGGILFSQKLDAQEDSTLFALKATVARCEQQYPPAQEPAARIPLAYAYCDLAEYLCQPPAQPAMAAQHVEKALAIVDQTSDAPARVRTYLLASVCAEQQPEKSEQVLGYSLKALQEARASNDSALIVDAYARVTDVHIARQEYSKADSYLKEAQAFFGSLKGKVELEMRQSLVYLEDNKPQKAIEGFHRLLSSAQQLVDVENRIKALNGLEKAATALGDTVNATRYHQLAVELLAKKPAPATDDPE